MLCFSVARGVNVCNQPICHSSERSDTGIHLVRSLWLAEKEKASGWAEGQVCWDDECCLLREKLYLQLRWVHLSQRGFLFTAFHFSLELSRKKSLFSPCACFPVRSASIDDILITSHTDSIHIVYVSCPDMKSSSLNRLLSNYTDWEHLKPFVTVCLGSVLCSVISYSVL